MEEKLKNLIEKYKKYVSADNEEELVITGKVIEIHWLL